MSFTDLIYFVFSVIGLTNIVVDSTIFAPVREYCRERCPKCYEMMTCHQCAGFWCGLICGVIIIPNFLYLVFASGFAGSFLASSYVILSDWIMSKTEFTIHDEEINE